MKELLRHAATICLWLAAMTLHGQGLAACIDSLIRVTPLTKCSGVGIAVYDLTDGRPLYGHNERKLFRPASTQKVITAVTASALLGRGYEFSTSISYSGVLEGDTLHGDLTVKGGLDPLFCEDDMDEMVEAVSGAGIRYVDGCLRGDVSMMDSLYWGPGWSYDDAPGYYQPYVSPLMVNGGYVDVAVTPSAKGTAPRVKVTPASDFYTVRNEALSRTPSLGKVEATRNWLEGGNDIIVTGSADAPYSAKLSLLPSQDFFLYTLLYKLRMRGINVSGGASTLLPQGSSDAAGVKALMTKRRPIKDVMERALKKSDNLCAEAMFIHLGLTMPGVASSGFSEGKEAVEKFMEDVMRRSPEECKVTDGSGLSPYNLVSPEMMADYLRRGAGDEMVCSSLPVAAVDGTLANRMKRGKTAGNVRAKTGSVTGVSTLAGYVRQTSTGHRLAFVIFCQNILKQRDARQFQDKVCELLAR